MQTSLYNVQPHAVTLPVGSKDLAQVVAQGQQGSVANRQLHNHPEESFDSNTPAHVRQQCSHALDNTSAHAEEERQDTSRKGPSSDNDGLPLVGKACPAATAATPSALQTSLQIEGETQHTTSSSSTALPQASSSLGASSNADQQQESRSSRDQKKTCMSPYVLFAIDGTWQEAKEIYKV